MKRYWLFVIVLVLLLDSCDLSSESADEVTTVSYCKLVGNPARYDKHIVRLSARHVVGFEWSYLADDSCPSSDMSSHIWILIPPSSAWCEGAKQTVSALPEGPNDSLEREVTVVGTFHHSTDDYMGYGHMGYYRFELDLICVEKAGDWRFIG